MASTHTSSNTVGAVHDSKVLERFLAQGGGASQFETKFSSSQVCLDHKVNNRVLARGGSLNSFKCQPKTKTGKVLDALLTGTAVLDQSAGPTETATAERDLSGLT